MLKTTTNIISAIYSSQKNIEGSVKDDPLQMIQELEESQININTLISKKNAGIEDVKFIGNNYFQRLQDLSWNLNIAKGYFSILEDISKNETNRYIVVLRNNQKLNQGGGEIVSIDELVVDRSGRAKFENISFDNTEDKKIIADLSNYSNSSLTFQKLQKFIGGKKQVNYNGIVVLDYDFLKDLINVVGDIKISTISVNKTSFDKTFSTSALNSPTGKTFISKYYTAAFQVLTDQWKDRNILFLKLLRDSLENKHMRNWKRNKIFYTKLPTYQKIKTFI